MDFMKIFVKAKPGAKERRIEKIDAAHFIVAVHEPPRGGQANAAIAEALAEYFNVAYSRVRLIRGFAAREKIFEVL